MQYAKIAPGHIAYFCSYEFEGSSRVSIDHYNNNAGMVFDSLQAYRHDTELSTGDLINSGSWEVREGPFSFKGHSHYADFILQIDTTVFTRFSKN